MLCSLLSLPPVMLFSSTWRWHHLSYTAGMSSPLVGRNAGAANSALFIYCGLFLFPLGGSYNNFLDIVLPLYF